MRLRASVAPREPRGESLPDPPAPCRHQASGEVRDMNSISKKAVKGILAAAALSILGSSGAAAAKTADVQGSSDDGFKISREG